MHIEIPQWRIHLVRFIDTLALHLLIWSIVAIKAYQSMDSSLFYTLFWVFLIPTCHDFLDWLVGHATPAAPAAPRAAAG